MWHDAPFPKAARPPAAGSLDGHEVCQPRRAERSVLHVGGIGLSNGLGEQDVLVAQAGFSALSSSAWSRFRIETVEVLPGHGQDHHEGLPGARRHLEAVLRPVVGGVVGGQPAPEAIGETVEVMVATDLINANESFNSLPLPTPALP